MFIDNLDKQQEPIIKDDETISKIYKASSIALKALKYSKSLLVAGTRANVLDEMIAKYIESFGASPANYEVEGYGYATSISVANEIAHGLPNKLKLLKHGDIVCVDIGVKYEDVYADFAKTFVIGGLHAVDKTLQNIIRVCDVALLESIKILKTGSLLSDYGKYVDMIVKQSGYKTVKFLTGHGVGVQYHEAPYVFNFYHHENDIILKEGMVFAFELMITNGSDKYTLGDDGWTLCTEEGCTAVHFEYTVAISDVGAQILGNIPSDDYSGLI